MGGMMDSDLDTGPDDFAPKPPPVDRDSKQLTVGQLIDKLTGYDRNRLVLAEGCDCINPVIDVLEEGPAILLEVSL
jgi:hypothetical protein